MYNKDFYLFLHRIKDSIGIAVFLFFVDAVWLGSFLLSFFICPLWLLLDSLLMIFKRPGWKIAIIRILIPPLTLAFIMGNGIIQNKIAESNEARIIAACEKFHGVTGNYPNTLDEIVPKYIPSIPRAKYCLQFGDFTYYNLDGNPILKWTVLPPFGQRLYYFNDRRWGSLD